MTELGRMAVAASEVEEVALVLAREFISHNDEVSYLLTKGWNFARACDVIPKLAPVRMAHSYRDVGPYASAWVDFARDAMRERHRYLHGFWSEPFDGTEPTWRREWKDEDPEPVTVKTLAEVTRRLEIARGNGYAMHRMAMQGMAMLFKTGETYEFNQLPNFNDGDVYNPWEPPQA